MNSKLWFWLGLSGILFLIALTDRFFRRGKIALSLSEFIALLGNVLGMVYSFELLYKALVANAWQNCLQEDDTVTLIFGGFALLWVAGNEVWKLIRS
jgi:hypothetical protein